jgi:hypothetical protein
MRKISPALVTNHPGWEFEARKWMSMSFFINVKSDPHHEVITRIWRVYAGYDSTNAKGSSGVDPGRSLVSIEIYPSSIGDSLDMLMKSCDCIEFSMCSTFDIHRMMDFAV